MQREVTVEFDYKKLVDDFEKCCVRRRITMHKGAIRAGVNPSILFGLRGGYKQKSLKTETLIRVMHFMGSKDISRYYIIVDAETKVDRKVSA